MGTVAILAQGTRWVNAAMQAFASLLSDNMLLISAVSAFRGQTRPKASASRGQAFENLCKLCYCCNACILEFVRRISISFLQNVVRKIAQ